MKKTEKRVITLLIISVFMLCQCIPIQVFGEDMSDLPSDMSADLSTDQPNAMTENSELEKKENLAEFKGAEQQRVFIESKEYDIENTLSDDTTSELQFSSAEDVEVKAPTENTKTPANGNKVNSKSGNISYHEDFNKITEGKLPEG